MSTEYKNINSMSVEELWKEFEHLTETAAELRQNGMRLEAHKLDKKIKAVETLLMKEGEL